MHRRLFITGVLAVSLVACAKSPGSAEGPRTVVFFTADSAGLDDSALATIGKVAEVARSQPTSPVHVVGFAAPDTGSDAYNKILAQARAQNVVDALIAAGVPRDRLLLESRGATSFEMMPTESRRVDILVGT